MPLPSLNITFTKTAATASRRSGQGVVAIILQDDGIGAGGFHSLGSKADIPAALSTTNKEYVEMAFTGNVNRPSKVLLYVLPVSDTDYTDAYADLATRQFDWLVCPPNCSSANATAAAAWIAGQRTNNDAKFKAVLPDTAADSEAIVNFTTDGIKVGGTTYASAGYCARIAGMLAGTPLKMSITYSPLTEIADITRLTRSAMDDAVDDGELLLIHDGEKVKIARGVTSLTTTTTKPADLKKIKIVEAIDLIRNDLRLLCQDSYIGKYANSYDNKCLLITAVKGYLMGLETDGILEKGISEVAIDIDATRAYLSEHGVDVSQLTDNEIKTADTGSNVFIAATVRILDAIEDITINITY